jgi:hypothetical protein
MDLPALTALGQDHPQVIGDSELGSLGYIRLPSCQYLRFHLLKVHEHAYGEREQ